MILYIGLIWKSHYITLEEANWKNTVEFVPLVAEGKVIKVYDCDTITIATKFPYLTTLNESKIMYRFHAACNGIYISELGARLQNNVASCTCASFSNGVASRAIANF